MDAPQVGGPAARAKAAWLDPAMLATPLACLFVDRYGTAALNWDPETVWLEVRDDFGAVPEASLHRLMAAVTILTTDLFSSHLPSFVSLCNVLSGDLLDPGMWDPADAAECAWGITEALLLDPGEGDDPFAPEIQAYVREACRWEGLLDPPDVLRIGGPIGHPAWAADPAIGPQVWASAAARGAAVTDYVRSRLRLLVDQVEGLPLESGDARDLAGRLRAGLNGKAAVR